MPSESDLRNRMRDDSLPPGKLDVAKVIRRARARRLPRVLAVGATACLTIAAVAVPVSFSMLGANEGSTLATSDAGGREGEDGAFAPETNKTDTMLQASADRLNLCGAALAEPSPAASGLELSIAPIDAPADAVTIETIVTLVNNGSVPVEGTTAGSPALTLSQDGVVLWHSNGPVPTIAVGVELAPGESLQYAATFEPVRCGPDDDLAPEGFADGLPSVGPGSYAISAAIDLAPLDGSVPELVTGPPAVVLLR